MTIRLAFIGAGGIAHHHLNTLSRMEGIAVTAFYDLDAARAEQAALNWSNASAYSTIEEMLDTAKPDGVYICVPPMAHGSAEELVMERGIPFMVEKPIGIGLDTPASIAAAVQKQGLITSVGYHWRYMDAVEQAKARLASSKLGMAMGYWMGGMPMVPWWRKMHGSGGQFVEQTTHIVDLVRYLCGEVTEVYAAYAERVKRDQVEGCDVPDVGTVTLKLANGAIANISNTCMLPVSHHVGLDLYTDQGVLEIRGHGLKVIHPSGESELRNGSDPTYQEDEAFIHAIRTGDTSRIRSDYVDAWKTHEVTIAANESAQTGKVVRIGETCQVE